MRQEPVLQLDGASAGAVFDPARGVDDQRRAGLRDGVADRGAADQLAIKAVEQQPRGLDVDGMAHGEHAADARLDQARRDGAEDGGLAHRGAAAGFEHDERDLVLASRSPRRSAGRDRSSMGRSRRPASRNSARCVQEGAVAVEVHEVVRVARFCRSRSISSMRASVGGRQKSTRTLAPSGSSASNSALVVRRGSMNPVSPGRLTM